MTSESTSAPTVSVIVPVYNAERYIAGTIESVLRQEFQDFELLLIDDCSTDASADRIRPYLSERVSYLRESTNCGGPSAPRNTGLRHARGRYMSMFDADDIMLPGKLFRSVQLLMRYPSAGLLCTNFQSFDDSGKLLRSNYLSDYQNFRACLQRLEENCFRLPSADAYRALLRANFVGTSSVLIPRHVLDEVGMFDQSLTNGDDYDMWLRIVNRYDLLFADVILHSYRIGPGSVSSRGANNVRNRIKVLERQIPKSLDAECRRTVQRNLRINYCELGDVERRTGHISAARRYLCQSLRFGLSWPAVKGLIVTLLPSFRRRAMTKK